METTVTEVNNALMGSLAVNTTEKRISELEDVSTETSKTEKK